jgi:Protein of unknown function (DUF4232)
LLALIASVGAAAFTPAASADADDPAPCVSGQVRVTAEPPQAAMSHRAVILTFGLAPGTGSCVLSGYPGVDTVGGDPPLHAVRTPWGYLGGLPSTVDEPPAITLSPSVQAHAVVEGVAVDDNGDPCPSYTGLRVTPPDTAETITVPTGIEACKLQVHPVTA